ncbi:hypothetical protein V5738_09680 [Salinisphaera sp. SPP-AMP-43]|uniref:hypothetical protein n=1 Tax=Salinisphaera sp. SPP-AMP-43 TaxID=3121288 RepID=UPI003C6E87B9
MPVSRSRSVFGLGLGWSLAYAPSAVTVDDQNNHVWQAIMANRLVSKAKRWLSNPRNQEKVKRVARTAYQNYKSRKRR